MRKSLTLCSDTLSSFSKKVRTPEEMEVNMENQGVSPSEQIIRNIMNYSRALSVIQTKEELLFRVMN